MENTEREQYREQMALLKEQYNQMVLDEEAKRKEEKVAPEGVYISLQHINKVYDNYVHAVYDFNLDIKKHEFIVFVGPSGCGKSTTLRMIAGLEDITTGDLYIDGEYCNQKTPKERDVAMVFQNYALYPHMNVYENLGFGLATRGYSKEEIKKAVEKAAKILEITEYLDRKPKQLSGGQMQRVALGRAIVRDAKVFLMDEPLSNLDAKLRISMRSEIIKLHKAINATTIYVTHDQTEAMTMATRIVVMKDGFIQQIGTPSEVYNHPANTFVATFIGAPATNLLNVKYEDGSIVFKDGSKIKLNSEEIKLHDEFYKKTIKEIEEKIKNKDYEKPDSHLLLTLHNEKPTLKSLFKKKEYPHIPTSEEKYEELVNLKQKFTDCLSKPHDLILGVRPEDIYEDYEIPSSVRPSCKFETKVELCELLGSEYHIHLNFNDIDMIAKCQVNKPLEDGSKFVFKFNLNKLHLFDAENKKSIF